MTREQATAFAEEWIRNWNNLDLTAILSHYTEDAQFRSPRAATVVGSPTLTGKAAMEAYWRAGIARITNLHFTLDYILWDEVRAELVIVYVADINERPLRACETFRFDSTGHVSEGEAMYGIAAR